MSKTHAQFFDFSRFCVPLALNYTQTHYADISCAAMQKEIQNHHIIFVLLISFFSCYFALKSLAVFRFLRNNNILKTI